MAHTEGWATRLVRELPQKEPEHLRHSRSYADPTFLRLFFEWLDQRIYDDPRAALPWAEIAPDLAQKTPEEDGPEGRQQHREQLLKAWMALGSAHRACGDYAAADDAYREARKVARSGSVSDSVRATMEYRMATLRARQGRADEALALATGAVATLRKVAARAAKAAAADADDATAAAAADAARLLLGNSLISRGHVLASELRKYGEAIDAFGEALTLALTSNNKSSLAVQRLHATACNNLAMAITEGSSLADLKKARLYIQQARQLLKGKVRNPARYRVLWVEGMIWAKTGSHARAEKLMRMALEGFQALKLPWEIALVGLDLAALLHVCGDWDELVKLAADTFERFRLLAADTQAIGALSLWNDAVKARREEELLEKLEVARRLVAARVFSGRSCKKRRR